VLFEYAGTLGLLDLDYVHPTGAREDFQENGGGVDLDTLSRYDGLQAIRLTALGRYALGLTDTYLANHLPDMPELRPASASAVEASVGRGDPGG